jgi:hypothetical protein
MLTNNMVNSEEEKPRSPTYLEKGMIKTSVTPYCKFKLRRITCFGPQYAKWTQYGLFLI